jgi:putative transposase
VGWSIDRRPTIAMVNSALGMAIEARKPTTGAVVHSDRGSSTPLGPSANASALPGWLSRSGTVGDAFDSAMVESWARMQTEFLNTRPQKTRVELSRAIFDWIEGNCNRLRVTAAWG